MTYRKKIAGAACTALLLSAATAFAGDPTFGTTSLSANPSVKMTNMTLTVSGPDGYSSRSSSDLQAPSMSLSSEGGLADGVYTWELTGASSEKVRANPMGLDNGRGAAQREYKNASVSETGSFRVVNGSIVTPDSAVEKSISPLTPSKSLRSGR